MPVVLALLQPVVLLQPGEDRLVGLLLRLPGEVAGVLVHPPVGADDGDDREAVVAADLEIGRVVAGRDLERAGAELGLDACVRDHRHGTLDVRDEHLLADRIAIALVVGVHGDGDVGEDRRRPHGRDRDVPGAVRERVAGVGERVVHVDVLDLEVRDRRLVEGAPVDDPLGAVDPAPVPEVDEEAHHRLDVGVVHREALAAVVERGAEPAVLAHDRAAGLLEMAPDALDERLAAELLARRALGRELLLDDVLGRDPGVVVARLPERVEALHPVPADQDVLQRPVEGVAHVQRAGDVRRRYADDERLVSARAGAGPVDALGLPGLLPAFLDALRPVQRLHRAIVGAGVTYVRLRSAPSSPCVRRPGSASSTTRVRRASRRRRAASPRRWRRAIRDGRCSPPRAGRPRRA